MPLDGELDDAGGFAAAAVLLGELILEAGVLLLIEQSCGDQQLVQLIGCWWRCRGVRHARLPISAGSAPRPPVK